MLEKHLFRDFKHGMPRVSRRAGQTIRELALKRRTKAVVSFKPSPAGNLEFSLRQNSTSGFEKV